jgi:hypothetical protein
MTTVQPALRARALACSVFQPFEDVVNSAQWAGESIRRAAWKD